MGFFKLQGDRFLGILYIIISATSFGAMPIFANIAYGSGADTTTVLFLRFTIASFIMLTWIFIKRSEFKLPSGQIIFALILMGFIGYGGQSFCYFKALTFIPSGTVAILLYLHPALVVGLSIIFLNQQITINEISALALALFGTVCVVGFKLGGEFVGYFFGIASAFIYSVYIIVGTKVLSKANAFFSSAVIITSAAMLYSIVVFYKGPTFPDSFEGWVATSMIAIVSTIVAIVTFFAGLKKLGPVHATMLSMIEPVVSVLLAWLFLGDLLSIWQIIGGCMVLIAGMLLVRKQPKERQNPPEVGR